MDISGTGCSECSLDRPASTPAFYGCFTFHVAGVKCSTEKHCKQIWKSNFKQQNATEIVFVITASASRKQGLLIYRPSYCQGLRQSNLWCKSQERFLDSQRSHILMTAKCIGFPLSLSKVAGKLFLQVHSSERNCKWACGLRDGEGVGGPSRRQSL